MHFELFVAYTMYIRVFGVEGSKNIIFRCIFLRFQSRLKSSVRVLLNFGALTKLKAQSRTENLWCKIEIAFYRPYCATQSVILFQSLFLLEYTFLLHCKEKMPKIGSKYSQEGISGPQSQFPHSCVCERIIYSHDVTAVSAGGNVWTDPGNI